MTAETHGNRSEKSHRTLGPDEAAGACDSALRHAASPLMDDSEMPRTPGESLSVDIATELDFREGRTSEPGKSKQNPMKRVAFRRLAWGVSDDLTVLKREVMELRGLQSEVLEGNSGLHDDLASLRKDVDQLHKAMQTGKTKVSTESSCHQDLLNREVMELRGLQIEVLEGNSGLHDDLASLRKDVDQLREAMQTGKTKVSSESPCHKSLPRRPSSEEEPSASASSGPQSCSLRPKRSRTAGPARGAEVLLALRKEVGEINDALARMHKTYEQQEQKYSMVCWQLDSKVQEACKRMDLFQLTSQELSVEISHLKAQVGNSVSVVDEKTRRSSAVDCGTRCTEGSACRGVHKVDSAAHRRWSPQLNVEVSLLHNVLAAWRNECLGLYRLPKKSETEESLIVEGGLLGVQERLLKVRERLLGVPRTHENGNSFDNISKIAPEDFTVIASLRNRIEILEQSLKDKVSEAAIAENQHSEVLHSLGTLRNRIEAVEGSQRDNAREEAAEECKQLALLHGVEIGSLSKFQAELQNRLEILEESRSCQRTSVAALDECTRIEEELSMRIEPLESVTKQVEAAFETLQMQYTRIEAVEQQLNTVQANQQKADTVTPDEIIQSFAEEKLGPVCEQLELVRDDVAQKVQQTEALYEKIAKEAEGQREAAHLALISDLPRRVAHLEAEVNILPCRVEILEKGFETTMEVANSTRSTVGMLQGDVSSLSQSLTCIERERQEAQKLKNSKAKEQRGSSMTRLRFCFRPPVETED